MATVDTVSRIENGQLPPAIRAAVSFIPRKSSRPALAGLRITADADGVAVTAGDADAGCDNIDRVYSTAFRARMPSNVFDAVADIVIPRAVAESWGKAGVESIDVDGVSASAAGMRANVETGGDFYRFPSVDNPTASRAVSFSTFKAISAHIGSATDSESSRYALGGIYLESCGDGFRAVGTDGRRLHVARIRGATDGAFNIVTPAAAWAAAARAIDRTIGEKGAAKKSILENLRVFVSVDDSAGRGMFSWAVGNCNYEIVWRRIDGRFPRYRDVFPAWIESASAAGNVDAADILRQSEFCRKSVCNENSKGIDIARNAGAVELSARSAEFGEYRQELKAYLPVGFKTKLDPSFVADAVSAAAAFDSGERVDVWVNPETIGTTEGEIGAVFLGEAGRIFRDAEPSPAVFAAVIMPLAAD